MINLPLETLLPSVCPVCKIRTNLEPVCYRCALSTINFDLIRCLYCFSPLKQTEEEFVCSACVLKKPIIEQVRFLCSYTAINRDYITSMKYTPSKAMCDHAGKLLSDNLFNLYPTRVWDLVVPIPSSLKAQKQRGFNPADFLVNYLPGKKKYHALIHRGYRSKQSSLSFRKRFSNVRKSFQINTNVNDQNILLVDDVITSSATINSAARTLLSAGANSVSVLSLARVDNLN